MHVGTFAGRVGRDAELKKLDSGRELLEFSLAVTVGWGDRKDTQWVKATVWGDRAAKLVREERLERLRVRGGVFDDEDAGHGRRRGGSRRLIGRRAAVLSRQCQSQAGTA